MLEKCNSKFKENGYTNHNIINSVQAIKNCIDKENALRTLRKNKVKCLKCYSLKSKIGLFLATFYIKRGLVLRKEKELKLVSNLKDFLKYYKYYDYFTVKEDKVLEYRVIMFKNKPLRTTLKLNNRGNFQLKQDNSKFIDVKWIRGDIIRNCRKATELLKIDLCGIDVLVNKKFDIRIIEVNSGMRLCRKSCEILKDVLY